LKKRLSITLFIFAIVVLAKFWIGIFEHDEFSNEKYMFVKHRAIWKTYFYSPRGMSDFELSDMTPENKIEQMFFDEFVLE